MTDTNYKEMYEKANDKVNRLANKLRSVELKLNTFLLIVLDINYRPVKKELVKNLEDIFDKIIDVQRNCHLEDIIPTDAVTTKEDNAITNDQIWEFYKIVKETLK